jgi:thiol-disulfide isomerase/thioredoxin
MAPPAREPSSPRAKLAVVAGAVVLVALLAWQTWRTLATRPELVPAPAASAAAQFGIDRADVPAPPFDVVALDGTRVSLAALRGQVVFVNFWATWCPPCREEMPSMVRLGQELMQKYPGRFRMVAMSVDDELAPVNEYFGAPPFSGPPMGLTIGWDADQSVTRAYYCTARGFCPDLKFPETYIVDRTGRLVAYIVGPRDWNHPAARAFLEGLIRS